MIEARSQNNLTNGGRGQLVLQLLPPNLRTVPVTLMNTNSYNVWIKQPVTSSQYCRSRSLAHGITIPPCPVMAVKSRSHSALCLVPDVQAYVLYCLVSTDDRIIYAYQLEKQS